MTSFRLCTTFIKQSAHRARNALSLSARSTLQLQRPVSVGSVDLSAGVTYQNLKRMSMACQKSTVCSAIDSENSKLRVLSLDIWDNPELCFEEHHAHKVITDFLEEKGFQVERSYKLPTAFRATASSKDLDEDSPHIGVMCEYDALPTIGHACGHNLIAIMGVSISLGIKEAFDNAGLKGKLTVLGCPAEEGGGGKIDLIQSGAFNDLDIAMMAHPSQFNLSKPIYVAMAKVDVRFEGMASHAASFPWDGVNALDAAVLCYQSVSCMRQQMKPTWRVHGIFTNGGAKPNIIPAEAALQYYARTPTSKELTILKDKLIACFNGAALSSGCKVTYTFCEKSYDSLLSNDVIASVYEENGVSLGIEFEQDAARLLKQGGSTDMGNVSRILPSLHPKYSLHTLVAAHTIEFADIVKTEQSHEVTLQHAKALAMTAVDIYNKPSLLKKIKSEFKKQMAQEG